MGQLQRDILGEGKSLRSENNLKQLVYMNSVHAVACFVFLDFPGSHFRYT